MKDCTTTSNFTTKNQKKELRKTLRMNPVAKAKVKVYILLCSGFAALIFDRLQSQK